MFCCQVSNKKLHSPQGFSFNPLSKDKAFNWDGSTTREILGSVTFFLFLLSRRLVTLLTQNTKGNWPSHYVAADITDSKPKTESTPTGEWGATPE